MILICSVIGAFILLDKMAIGEFGLSQPIIACPLIGLIFGSFHTGLFLGAIIQLVWIGALPLGSKEPPDNQTAGIVAITSFLLAQRHFSNSLPASLYSDEKILFASLIFAGVAAVIGQFTVKTLKKFNRRLFLSAVKDLSNKSIRRANFLGLITSFLRGFLTIGMFLILFYIISPLIRLLPQFTYRELLIVPLLISTAALVRFVVIQKKYVYSVFGILTGFGLWLILIS
ncbi:MAG: PTS sugar transporter subunit IIC [Candidatus Latescibacteria bacterium]|nr:PTS sugar transporter subunit IIC [Candidatus Latescibacterota bacterium]